MSAAPFVKFEQATRLLPVILNVRRDADSELARVAILLLAAAAQGKCEKHRQDEAK
jgi:hypothetical protein